MLHLSVAMQFKDSIGYLLHQLAHLIDAESNQVLSERLGIGFAQFKVLTIVDENQDITQKQIADNLSQTQASISRQIKILESKNLVKTKRNQSNLREHHIVVTAKGQQMVEKATRALNSYHAPMFSHLSEREQLKIIETLQLIRSSIDR